MIDFESRSTVDLSKTGVYPYAENPDTDVWCAAWAIDNEAVQLWIPGEPCPSRLVEHVAECGLLAAWNANFEIALWKHILHPRYGWPLPDLSQWRCSMVMAYAMSLPGALENAAGAVGLDIGKDMTGRRLMLAMSQPRRPRKDEPDGLYWWDDEDRRSRLYAYCKNDVEVERAIRSQLVALRSSEQALWHLDQKINGRGVYVDKVLCQRAKAVVAHVTKRLNADMARVTDYAVTACSNINNLKTFVRSKGVDTEALDKEALAELLKGPLPTGVREALELRQEAGKASVAKIEALLNGTSADGRARGLLQFHAANTGRWAGRRFQPQNIRRPSEETDVDAAIEIILSQPPAEAAVLLECLYGPPLTIVSDCLRGMIKASPGRKLVSADFSNIEGRVLAWLAGERGKLDAFEAYDRGEGPDLYKVMAGSILNKQPNDITKDERQAYGKVPELACGYQGGVGAFQTMAHTYGVKIEDVRAELIVQRWRAANPNIKQYWRDLEDACFGAVTNPGSLQIVRNVKFKVVGSFLWMQLPSGRAICFPYPAIVWKEMPWLNEDTGMPARRQVVSFKGVNSYSRKWETQYLYGGKEADYATQGTARDLLAAAIVRVEAHGYPVILTIHDDALAEPKKDFGSAEQFEELMIELPPWAAGLPVAAEAWEGERYRK
jgi:DNA polymerase